VAFFIFGTAFMIHLFAVGFVSLLGQVVILRELNVAFYGVELIYTLALGVWLFLSACGAMIGRRNRIPSFFKVHLLFLALSAVLPLDIAFIRASRWMFSNTPGAYLPLYMQMAVLCASLLPLGLFVGLLFQWTAKIYVAKEKTLAAAYAIESLGGLTGGICATLFLKLGFQNFVIALLCALSATAVSFLNLREKKAKALLPVSAIIAAAMVAFLWKAPAIDRLMTSWTHPNLVETHDSPYSRITVSILNDQVSVFENDALLFETEGSRAEEFVHPAALQHPRPDRVLVLGGGIEGTVREILQHCPRLVDYVELNAVLLDVVSRSIPYEIERSLQADNVRVIIEDPRNFLRRSMKYDLILVGMPEPDSGQANRYYTKEFFQQCSERLTEGGLIAFRLQSSENLWTPQLTRRMVSIYRALKSVFPEVQFIPGITNVVIGSTDRLIKDPSILAARLQARQVKGALISPAYLRYLYSNDRFDEIDRILRNGTAPINTDVRPICYRYSIMIWLSKFGVETEIWDTAFSKLWYGRKAAWLLLLLLPAALLYRARWTIRRALLAGMTAFAGMVLETILLLRFQIKNGILYQDIGILLMSFMAGLALGAYIMDRIPPRLLKKFGVALLAGFVLLSATIGFGIHSGTCAGLAATTVLLILSGFFVAGIFAYAGLRKSGDPTTVIAPLYAADLAGGCLGSLIASLMLVPIAGMTVSAFLMVPLLLFAAVLV
jgi:spermidine synthase